MEKLEKNGKAKRNKKFKKKLCFLGLLLFLIALNACLLKRFILYKRELNNLNRARDKDRDSSLKTVDLNDKKPLFFTQLPKATIGVGARKNYLHHMYLYQKKPYLPRDVIGISENELKEDVSKKITKSKRELDHINLKTMEEKERQQNKKYKSYFESITLNHLKDKVAILMMTYNRPDYLQESLKNLANVAGINQVKRIVISQQISDPKPILEPLPDILTIMETRRRELLVKAKVKEVFQQNDVIQRFMQESPIPVHHYRKYGRLKSHIPSDERTGMIAQHYKYALKRMINEELVDDLEYVIILEDDLVVSKDLLQYFDEMAPLLTKPEEKVGCISAFNDFGHSFFHLDATKSFRTQHFPGLGWMVHRSFLEYLVHPFPNWMWDWWMIGQFQTLNLDCVVPELSRVTNIGKERATNGAIFTSFLSTIQTSSELTALEPYTSLSLSLYNERLRKVLRRAKVMPLNDHANSFLFVPDRHVILPYTSPHLSTVLKSLNLMDKYEPNTHHDFVIHIPYTAEKHLYLMDIRRSIHVDLISSTPSIAATLKQDAAVVPTPSRFHESCRDACARSSLRCNEALFDVVNSCSLLQSFFSCQQCLPYTIGHFNQMVPLGSIRSTPIDMERLTCYTIIDWRTTLPKGIHRISPTCDAASTPFHPARRLCPCT